MLKANSGNEFFELCVMYEYGETYQPEQSEESGFDFNDVSWGTVWAPTAWIWTSCKQKIQGMLPRRAGASPEPYPGGENTAPKKEGSGEMLSTTAFWHLFS